MIIVAIIGNYRRVDIFSAEAVLDKFEPCRLVRSVLSLPLYLYQYQVPVLVPVEREERHELRERPSFPSSLRYST